MSDRVRLLLSLLSGGLFALAFPGTGDQGWLAFTALAPLLVAIEGTAWRRAASLGFVAGLVFWLATIPWVAATMVRYGSLSWALAGLVLVGLAGYLALYLAAFCAAVARRVRLRGVVRRRGRQRLDGAGVPPDAPAHGVPLEPPRLLPAPEPPADPGRGRDRRVRRLVRRRRGERRPCAGRAGRAELAPSRRPGGRGRIAVGPRGGVGLALAVPRGRDVSDPGRAGPGEHRPGREVEPGMAGPDPGHLSRSHPGGGA